MISLPHNSPKVIDEAIEANLWHIQGVLRRWFQPQIEDARPFDHGKKGPEWWVWQSHAKCKACGIRKLRVTIRGHPDGPFYLCFVCGSLETLMDLTR